MLHCSIFPVTVPPLPDRTATPFSPVKPGDTDQVPDGMRDFFLYRDLRIAAATGRSRQ